jgi:deoxyribonuclease V
MIFAMYGTILHTETLLVRQLLKFSCVLSAMATYTPLHDWNLSPTEAIALQQRLRSQVEITPLDVKACRLVAGADISFNQNSNTVYAGFVVISLPSLEVVEQAGVKTESPFPYVPGLLSFREIPPLLEAWTQLQTRPDAVICDGQGLAHPRRFGLACHLGLILDLPAVGCAKSRFIGTHEPPDNEVGRWASLRDKSEEIGAVLRTRPNVSPVYVSVGHRCDLPSALDLVQRCVGKTRLPETTRQAHLFVNELRRADLPDIPA